MANASGSINFDHHDQIQLLTNIREDIQVLLAAHPKGVWFQMLPSVFSMHFHRDMHLDRFAIPNALYFLDYISDLIKFELPDNLNEEDFIIEFNVDQKEAVDRAGDARIKREGLVKMLQHADLQTRGAILREICIIDENFKRKDNVPAATHEQVAVRLQKIRSMVDLSLRRLLQTPQDISAGQLNELYDQCNGFIADITPFVQRLSSSTH